MSVDKTVHLFNERGLDAQDRMDLFSTHTSLEETLPLLELIVNEDDLDAVDQKYQLLGTLIKRHRELHKKQS